MNETVTATQLFLVAQRSFVYAALFARDRHFYACRFRNCVLFHCERSYCALCHFIAGKRPRWHGINPRWLTTAVTDLTRQFLGDGDTSRLPILSDALMDAGCDVGRWHRLCHERVGLPVELYYAFRPERVVETGGLLPQARARILTRLTSD